MKREGRRKLPRDDVETESSCAAGYILAISVVVVAIAMGWLYSTFKQTPVPRAFVEPPKTHWKPVGVRLAGEGYGDYEVIPQPDSFHTMHTGVNNDDSVWITAGVVTEEAWSAEPDLFVPEGPTFDNEGNLYFSPLNPKEDISLVCLDVESGQRRWVLPDGGGGGGAVLVLNDPDSSGKQIIYHATYENAWAVRPDGSVLWHVKTGLTAPPQKVAHHWGFNYHPQTDSLVGLVGDGQVFVLARSTGAQRLSEPFQLPGAPAGSSEEGAPSKWVQLLGDKATDQAFGRLNDGRGVFTAIVDVIFGGGTHVANYFCIDPNTGRIYIAATAPDQDDGVEDGVSRNGALYMLRLSEKFELEVLKWVSFPGGTGSTPTMSADSSRMVVSDDEGNVVVFDADLNLLWKVNVGAQIAASVAVSPDNREMYAVTRFDVFKIRDHGTHGEIVWKAVLDAYPGFVNVNALTPTIAANGIVVSVAAVRELGSAHLLYAVGMGLLDRETGHLRSFTQGVEESIAVSSVGPDGSLYQALSPVRHAVSRSLLGNVVLPLRGGITRYRPVRPDLQAREAACAGADRATNAATYAHEASPSALRDERLQILALIRQCDSSLVKYRASTDASPTLDLGAQLRAAEQAIQDGMFREASSAMQQLCDSFS